MIKDWWGAKNSFSRKYWKEWNKDVIVSIEGIHLQYNISLVLPEDTASCSWGDVLMIFCRNMLVDNSIMTIHGKN